MKTYIFEMTNFLDLVTAQSFEAVLCWDHCQMFYQPIYYVRTIAGSDKPCPFCELQDRLQRPIASSAADKGKVDGGQQLSLFDEAA